ncbi:hypothetical protein HPB49_008300 [Dermacentor silvarum]|uniref:Uncharacterized protein n=1 Tax=Dermacentor silvarum TaxID=543639 RepID=A0ACB8C2Q8_DERSI|nr:hypothetical protein HPB49_008300 [Dermacentor silvarum]
MTSARPAPTLQCPPVNLRCLLLFARVPGQAPSLWAHGKATSQQQSSRSRVRPDDENGDEATVRQESTGRRSSRSQASSERACDVCGRRFANSSHLARHRRTHRGSSDEFLCADCLLSFARKDALQRHMLTHTGLRPYICRVCGSAFTQRSSATRHERNIHGLP